MTLELEPGVDPAWYVIETRSRSEMTVAKRLEDAGYATFVPTHIVKTRQNRRRVTLNLPLFPRYLFVGMHPMRRVFSTVRATKGVVDFLQCDGRPYQVDREEIRRMRAAMARGEHDEVRTRAIKLANLLGKKIELSHGPFAGFLAVVLKASKGMAYLEIRNPQSAHLVIKVPVDKLDELGSYSGQDDQQQQISQSARRLAQRRG